MEGKVNYMKIKSKSNKSGPLTALSALAEQLQSTINLTQLALPETTHQRLLELASHIKHKETKSESIGHSANPGVIVLFAGASGAGKTMAATALAKHLELALYRIDLNSIVGKYIGETEKNLRQLFDAAEEGGAILFFDEADALFGKRSEVKDSHGRYANIEIGYLLQRIESFQGLIILSSKMKSNIDPAFLRRLHYTIEI